MASGPPGGMLPAARSSPIEFSALAERQRCWNAEGYDPTLDSVIAIFRESVAAEGTLITWDDEAGERAVLFASGSAAEGAFIDGNAESTEICWRTIERAGCRWDAMTSSMPVGGGTVTMSAFFRELGEAARVRIRKAAQMHAPLLRTLVALWAKQRQVSLRLGALTHALNNSGPGVMLLDNRGRLLFANETAEHLLDGHDGIRRSSDSIAATHLADSVRLHAAVEHVIASVADRTNRSEAVPVIALRRAGDERPLMAALVPHRVRAGPSGTDEAAAIVYLFDPGQDLRRRLEPACRLYGLSPVETRLASLLAEGATLAEAAEKLRIREQTARSYLKQIFGKTDTSRQAQLVSLLLRSCVHAAPGCSLDIL